MPAGADTVVIQELTARDGDAVDIQKPTAKGRNVRVRGIDFRKARCCCARAGASATAT